MILEIIRALVKANYPREEIDKAYDNLVELMETGAIRRINVSNVLSMYCNFNCRTVKIFEENFLNEQSDRM